MNFVNIDSAVHTFALFPCRCSKCQSGIWFKTYYKVNMKYRSIIPAKTYYNICSSCSDSEYKAKQLANVMIKFNRDPGE
jgi:hypothetical protein